MQKLKDGNVAPWNWGSRFKDGSLRYKIITISWGRTDVLRRVDIPVQALNLYFNGKKITNPMTEALLMIKFTVTHPVVSQVNPHVHLFFFAPRGSAGKPVAHRKGKGMCSIVFSNFYLIL